MDTQYELGKMILDNIISHNKNNPMIFGLTGAAWYSFDKILQEYINLKKIKYIHASNEAAGCYMAAYYAESTDNVGIAITTSGPGTSIAITGIASVYNEEIPLICFCGVPVDNFQNIDRTIVSSITKGVFYIDQTTDNPENIILQSFAIAKMGTNDNPGPGPVVIFVKATAWQTQFTEKTIIPYNLKYPHTKCIFKKINKLIAQKPSLIILRVGDRVSVENVEKIAILTNNYPNVFLHLTEAAKNNLDVLKYTNVGIEGLRGNMIINSNYSIADIIIDIGVGPEYLLSTFADINNVPGYPLKSTVKIYSIHDENLTVTSQNINTKNIQMSANYFVSHMLKYVNFSSSVDWATIKRDALGKITDGLVGLNMVSEKYAYQTMMLNKYHQQTDNNIYTTGSVIAHILLTIYNKNNSLLSINDNNLYVCDIGLASYIAEQLIYHRKIGNVLSFDQFSSIGSSMASAAGKILSGKYDDMIIFMGDGGFINTPGYLIDLVNSLKMMSMRCLFVMLNDNKYSNVTMRERDVFGYITDITSTAALQLNVNLFEIIDKLSGGCINSLKEKDIKNYTTSISDFVSKWYDKADGFTQSGVYVLYYETNTLASFM